MLGDLWVVSLTFAVLIGVVVVLAWAGLWLVRHRSGGTRWLAASTATLLTLCLGLTLVNDYFSYLPRVRDVESVIEQQPAQHSLAHVVQLGTAAARKWPKGTVSSLPIPDRGSGFGASSALVYLPPQYLTEPTQRFPVVYLFHGSPGVPADWFRGGEAADEGARLAQAGHPVIIVAPRMSHGWLDDPECVDGIHEKVEQHLLLDVLPTVDGRLRTQADRAGRIFGGMSAGGYCALNLGLRNRGLVSTIIDMSGFTMPTHTGGMADLFGPPSPTQRDLVRANSPDLYASSLSMSPPMRIWLDSGSEDGTVLREMRLLMPVLQSRGVQVSLHVRAGAHTFWVWRPALRASMAWAEGSA
jgi:enterochelin esterase-like enzyme